MRRKLSARMCIDAPRCQVSPWYQVYPTRVSNRADSLLRFLSFSVERAAVDAVLYTHTQHTRVDGSAECKDASAGPLCDTLHPVSPPSARASISHQNVYI